MGLTDPIDSAHEREAGLMLTLNTHVMADGASRAAFNALTLRTFGFSFEEWYRAGYGSANNIPYTLFDGAKAVANVSVNLMDVVYAGKKRRYIQLGTVMTEESFRGRGLCSRLMQTVLAQWSQRCDAMLLFANRCALDFYPRFGFERQKQASFRMPLDTGEGFCRRLDMDSPGDRQIALRCYGQGNPFSALQVVDQAGLMMFYALTTRKEDMLYVPSCDALVVAGQEENLLRVYDVFCAPESGTLAQILRAAAQPGTRAAELMFTPVERGGMDVGTLEDEDDALFLLRGGENIFRGGEWLFPALAHT